MGGILRWLDNFFTNAASSAVDAYLQVVHWAIRGITSLVFGQFNNTAGAWKVYYVFTQYYTEQVRTFVRSVSQAAGYTLHVRIPGVVRWAGLNFWHIFSGLAALATALRKAVAVLEALITRTAKALTTWVINHVWAPLYAFAKKIYADLLKWGYTAWWWITHLDKLAESMIFHIATSLERNAWKLAGMLGKFALSLIMHNARRIALLVESIVTAVI